MTATREKRGSHRSAGVPRERSVRNVPCVRTLGWVVRATRLTAAMGLLALSACEQATDNASILDASPPSDASSSTDDAGPDGPKDAAHVEDAASPPLNVLFIGNSYTYVNDLPGMTAALVTISGRAIVVDSVAVGGATLQDLWNAGDAQRKITGGTFTHVVLQGQSEEPCLDTATYEYYAEQLAALARARGAARWYGSRGIAAPVERDGRRSGLHRVEDRRAALRCWHPGRRRWGCGCGPVTSASRGGA